VSPVSVTCGCCAGVAQRTPVALENRPGLSAVAYRVGVHRDFLASMIAGLTAVDRPRLAGLGTRDSDDFSIALLDAWAVTSDVLAFYNERLANESYLRTARSRTSLQELARLLGYRLRPGVAAETYLAFALEPPPDVPAQATKDPGSAPPVTPESVTLEPGLRVQSIPGPGEQPQTFETVEEVEARPEWNAMAATQTQPTPALGSTFAYLDGVGLNLKVGDLVLIAQTLAPAGSKKLKALKSVVEDAEHDRTFVSWSGAEAPPTSPSLYVMRKRLSVFGHNAPDQRRVISTATSDWTFALTGATPVDNWIDLDGSQPDVVPDSLVLIAQPNVESQLRRVEEVVEVSRADYGISGKVTRIKVAGATDLSAFGGLARTTTVYGASEPLKLADTPNFFAVFGDEVEVAADVTDMAPGRRLIVRGTIADTADEHAEPVVVKEIQGQTIVLEDDLEEAYQRDTVVVHGNVAAATHGETVHQLLGSGRASEPFQRFTLAHAPLTYIQSTDDPAGADAALEVRVNDVRWNQVPTLFGGRPGDRAYVLRTDEKGADYVQFGDGARGARLPTGANNVRARYRKGIGAGGNVKPGALAQLLDRPLGVKGVSNPMAASGGVDPEPEEDARGSIPLGVRTLGRAVSLLDYEDFARAFTGVAKAHAAVLTLRAGRTIVVTVAFEGGERLEDLGEALKKYGDPRVQVVVLAATSETFRVGLEVGVDEAFETGEVLSGVESALRAAYSFDARALTEPVFASDVVAVAHTVPGVLGIDLDLLYKGTAPGPADRLLAQRPAVGPDGTPIAAGLLELSPDPFDELETMT
jgi:predicted phage baseplate assembly protein